MSVDTEGCGCLVVVVLAPVLAIALGLIAGASAWMFQVGWGVCQ